jgi:hypothetical protein
MTTCLHGSAGLCTGLTAVLEAVDELPACGLPIPSSAQAQVRRFLEQQLDKDPAATTHACSHGCVLPETVKTLSGLQQHLQELADYWSKLKHEDTRPLISAAPLLVAFTARAVAQQRMVGTSSPAYKVLLIEGYRAGMLKFPSCPGHALDSHSHCSRHWMAVAMLVWYYAVEKCTHCSVVVITLCQSIMLSIAGGNFSEHHKATV